MNHLTTSQLMQFSDGTADFATQAACSNHLAVCAICRKEVEVQKLLLLAARRMPLVAPSKGFTGRVMRSVVRPMAYPVAARVLNNLGNVFGMMLVLGVVGYFVMNPVVLQRSPEPSETSKMVDGVKKTLDGGYAWLKNSIRALGTFNNGQEKNENGSEKVYLLIFVGVGIVVLADRYLLKPMFTKRT